MKAECVYEKLKELLQQAEKIAGRNPTLPVLSCVLLIVGKGELTIRATNLDLGFEGSLPVKVSEEGVLAVPAAVFSSFISNAKSEKGITLVGNGNNLSISTSRNKTIIKCLPHDDFPTIPEPKQDAQFEMKGRDLSRGLKAVLHSASISSVKPELGSVCVYADDQGIVFVATDSFRLSEKRVRMKSLKEVPRTLIPLKNAGEIARVAESAVGDVSVSIGKHQMSCSYSSARLVSRLVEGSFPDYHAIIPKEFKTEAVVLKEDLLNALKLATVFSDTFNQVTLLIHPKEKRLELTTRNGTYGENTTTLSAALSGEDVESSFNHRYLSDGLQSIETDSVSLSLSGAGRPMVVRGVSDTSFTYLVMPMNR